MLGQPFGDTPHVVNTIIDITSQNIHIANLPTPGYCIQVKEGSSITSKRKLSVVAKVHGCVESSRVFRVEY